MADNSQKMSYNAGVAKGRTQEKLGNIGNMAGDAAQSAKKSLINAGQEVGKMTQGAADAAKKATGIKK